VGTGFSESLVDELRPRLDDLAQDANPFDAMPVEKVDRGTQWVEPVLVAQVQYANWTGAGLLRHATFQGLREDVLPENVILDVLPRLGESIEREQADMVDRKKSDRHRRGPDADQFSELGDLQMTHSGIRSRQFREHRPAASPAESRSDRSDD
jgi:hypothetical protein